MRLPPPIARLAACAVLTTVAVPAPLIAAQEVSPVAGAVACTVEPRDVDELIEFYFSPEGTPLATPAMTTVETEQQLPLGEPVDAATEEAVNAVITELIACSDAGQYARAFALMTDDLARQLGPDVSNPDEDTPEEVRALLEAQIAGTPVTDEGTAETTTEVGRGRDLRKLDGGQVGGIWTIEGDAAFLVYEQEDGRWLLDEIIDIAEDEAAATGTPQS